MTKLNQRSKRTVAVVAALIVLAIVCRVLGNSGFYPRAIGLVRSIIYIFLFAAVSLGKPEHYWPPHFLHLLWIPTVLLVLTVLTNDLHQTVFVFSQEYPIWTDDHYAYFSCGTYSKKVDECTMHFISYNTLYAYVLERLLKNGDENRTSELRKAEKRKNTVNELFVKMYEDWSAGRITEGNFNLLSERYQAEQAELDEKIASLGAAIENDKQSAEDAEKWVKLIRQYSEITELDAPLLNTLIEKILVHEGKRGPDGIREQEVEIFYRFAGKIDI